jgi:hypothetical protein
MADWQQVHSFVHANFKAEDVSPGLIKLLFDVGNLSSQVVFLMHLVTGEDEWVSIESVVGELGAFDLAEALQMAGDLVVGGLARRDSIVVLKTTVPILNLDINELVGPMGRIVNSADDLESQLTGADRY